MFMNILFRLLILAGVALLGWLGVVVIRWYASRQRASVLMAEPSIAGLPSFGSPVHILVFSSADCSPCRTLQHPAIERVLRARGDTITYTEVDAPTSPELTDRFHIMTVPSTVVLDRHGRSHAVNYGYADEKRLLTQIDAVLQEQG